MNKEHITIIKPQQQLESFMQDDNLLILYFWAPQCSVCEAVFPRICNIADEHNVKVLKINIKENIKISAQFLVFTVPTIIVLKDTEEILRESRFVDFNKIDRILTISTGH